MDKVIEWLTDKFQHPMSLLFFVFGAILLLLGLTTSITLPGLQKLTPEVDTRWVSLMLGVIFVLVSVFVYYNPPSPSANERQSKQREVVPEDLQMSFAGRLDGLSGPQRQILSFIRRKGMGRSFVSQDTLEVEFERFSNAEMYYRLEHLRLLMFIEKQMIGRSQNGYDRYSYRITSEYLKELGNAEPVVA